MKVIKVKAHQTTANYKLPKFYQTLYTYDIPPYSTVIGMIHSVCGFKEYVDMDISVQTRYASKFEDIVYFHEFMPNFARKEYLETNKYDIVIERGRKENRNNENSKKNRTSV